MGGRARCRRRGRNSKGVFGLQTVRSEVIDTSCSAEKKIYQIPKRHELEMTRLILVQSENLQVPIFHLQYLHQELALVLVL